MSSTPPVKSARLASGDPLPTAVIDVTIDQFRPMGGIFPCFATFAFAPGQTPVPNDPDSIYFTLEGQPDSQATLTLDVNNFAVDTPSTVAIVFRLADWNYVFLGIAWASSDNSVGRLTFPQTSIQNLPPADPLPPSSLMTVVDDPTADANSSGYYRYLILVQNAATGEIGMIDPSIKNKPHA